MSAEPDLTDDAVLGGRLRLLQPRRGHRVGHDAILLAAATAARAGDHAIDFGAGVGAAGLALAVRVPGLRVTLVDIDAGLARLAADNSARNGMAERVRALRGDVADPAVLTALRDADHVLMNPPFNDPERQQSSPDANRRRAHVADPALLARWCSSAAFVLKPSGTLTLIWRAAALAEVMAALGSDFGAATVLPVVPQPGAAPIRVLVRAVKGAPAGRQPDLPPLILREGASAPSAAAEAVLRHAQPLALAENPAA